MCSCVTFQLSPYSLDRVELRMKLWKKARDVRSIDQHVSDHALLVSCSVPRFAKEHHLLRFWKNSIAVDQCTSPSSHCPVTLLNHGCTSAALVSVKENACIK